MTFKCCGRQDNIIWRWFDVKGNQPQSAYICSDYRNSPTDNHLIGITVLLLRWLKIIKVINFFLYILAIFSIFGRVIASHVCFGTKFGGTDRIHYVQPTWINYLIPLWRFPSKSLNTMRSYFKKVSWAS